MGRLTTLVMLGAFASGCEGLIVAGEPAAKKCEDFPPTPGRIVRLDAGRYRKAVDQLFSGRPEVGAPVKPSPVAFTAPLSRTNPGDRYSTRAASYRVDETDLEEVWAAAVVVVPGYLAEQLEDPRGCLATRPGDEACVRATLATAGAHLFGRPLDEGELASWALEVTAARQEGLTPLAAVEVALRAMLVSPDFLFRREEGRGGTLDDFERATLVSFVLEGAPPDGPLWSDAVAQRLDEATVRQHVRRLLSRPTELEPLRRFLRELFLWDATLKVPKDGARYPFHDAPALAADTERVVERLLEEHARGGLLRALLTSDLAYVRPSTRTSWGVDVTVPAEGTWLRLPNRSGLLTHPSWLSGFSENEHNQLVRRGRFVRERLLCGEVPNLPAGVVPVVADAPGLTLRARITTQTAGSSCQGCHRLMDSLGFGLEGFDHTGRLQSTDNGAPVSTEGWIASTQRTDGAYQGARDYMEHLAASPEVHACFVRQLFTSFAGRAPTSEDACVLARLEKTYLDSGEDVLTVLEDLLVWQATAPRVQENP